MAKRAPNKAGSIRQRPDGRWEGRITVVDPLTGQKRRRSVYGDTQSAVRKEMTSIIKSVDDGTYIEPSKMTVKQWLDAWMEKYCKPALKPLTYETYQITIRKHITPYIGNMKLQAVRGVHIQDIYNKMTDEGLNGKTVKNTSVLLHKAFGMALKQGYMTTNPVDATELPRVVKKEIVPLSDEEIPLFLTAINDSEYKNAFALSLFTGMRLGEVLGLSWGQVDFKKKEIIVNQQLQKGKTGACEYYIAPYTKNSKPRTIKPPPIAFDYLKDEQAKQIGYRLRAGKAWTNPDNLVFTNPLGEHLAFKTYYTRFKKIGASIGRPDLRPHDLRHTFATMSIALGIDDKAVSELLGHSSVSFTHNNYVELVKSWGDMVKQSASDKLQSYYDRQAGNE